MCLESEKFVSIWTKGKLGYVIILLTLFYNSVALLHILRIMKKFNIIPVKIPLVQKCLMQL